jgi:hypothetical protein
VDVLLMNFVVADVLGNGMGDWHGHPEEREIEQ